MWLNAICFNFCSDDIGENMDIEININSIVGDIDAGISSEMEKILEELSAENNLRGLRQVIESMNYVDAAKALEYLTPEQQITVFRTFPKDTAAGIFTYVDSAIRLQIVKSLESPRNTDRIKQDFMKMFQDLAVDDAVDVLDELPANLVEELLSQCTKDKREQLNSILNYPPNSAGSLMTVEYIILRESMTVAEALSHIRKQGRRKETIYNCYAVGPGRKLLGVLSLRTILLSNENVLIKDIMTTPVIFAGTLEDQEEVAAKFKEYDLIAMPVVDREERVVGIITIDDIVDVIEAENTEDFEKMSALRPSEDEYIKTGIFTLARNRIVWLLLLMASATFTECIITHFNDLFASHVILASFFSTLMGTGGNCGAQASTLVIRGMAVGEVELENWLLIAWKEIRVGATVGLLLCLANIMRMLIFTKDLSLPIVIIVNVTLMIVIIFAKLTGCLLPMIAKKFKFDPALMASPMITTIVDVFALFVYFSIAHKILD